MASVLLDIGNLVLLLEMVDNILDDSKKEQHFVVTRNIPSIEQYWDYRTGTNLMEALYPVTSLVFIFSPPRMSSH